MKNLLILIASAIITTPCFANMIILNTANTVNFRGTVDGRSITQAQLDLMQQIKRRGNAVYPIYLVLDSGGGSIVAGESFIEFAKNLPNIHTISIFAASMASAIVESMPGRRYILSSGILMFHRAAGQFEGQFETGEVESQLALWKSIVQKLEQRNANRLQIPLQDYKAKVVNELWYHGVDAVTNKAADAVVNIMCTPELIDARSIITVGGGMFSRTAIFSGCPLFRAPLPNTKPQTEEEEEEE